ncbi:hypothetical protein A3B84_01415 [Candidatus Nomurabacteria bacterium RIFCSPHIGHO2_02_FULL_35_13]|uniref:DUF5666 domain-containing protein n=1 Tax=Candidatus Nomurabacteria bacterium RIFCSPHIGHO2_02_FULL_35_13 TaxID=1801748 RepID=A0A1F6VNH9_9BACT|nr:MAG: hypothetical protein A3B84_01415 [Candidatus Nomurabacteria bacterium RIFCSPHIGHO2_02_FULL_35_13]
MVMKKYLKFGLIASVFVVLGFVGINVFAQTSSVSSGPGSPSSGSVSPMILNISPNGNVLMRGVVESSSADFVIVKSWGGSWKVEVSSTTKIMSTNRAVSDLQTGDFVGVLGNIIQDGSFVVKASIVREWRQKENNKDNDKDSIPDDQDTDDDNDGISDVSDSKPRDHDNDSISDDQDTDSDDDGISDDKDSKQDDHDNDGFSDSQDDDDDNDSILDVSDSKKHDRDNDGNDDKVDDRDDSSGSGSGN